jgi:hypothetical protein
MTALQCQVTLSGYELTDHAAKPDRTEADRSDTALTHALGRIAERDGRILRVVYNGLVNPPRIVTVYFDRRQRGKT